MFKIERYEEDFCGRGNARSRDFIAKHGRYSFAKSPPTPLYLKIFHFVVSSLNSNPKLLKFK
jgi:hypothetical protein